MSVYCPYNKLPQVFCIIIISGDNLNCQVIAVNPSNHMQCIPKSSEQLCFASYYFLKISTFQNVCCRIMQYLPITECKKNDCLVSVCWL